MKRLILTTTATVAGLAALLSFKTETAPVSDGAALPSAAASTGAAAATGTSSSAASTPAASSSKTYTGQAVTTRYGVIQVAATVANGRITNVSFVQLTAFDGRSQQINSDAAPQLLQETLQQQSAKVDTISGASYTSEGYRESLQSALDKAGLK